MFSRNKQADASRTADGTPADTSAESLAGPQRAGVGFEHQEEHEPGKLPALFVLRRTIHEFDDDEATDLAAALTYYSVLAIFPGLIAVLSLVALFGQAQTSVDQLLEILRPLVSPTIIENIRGPLDEIASSRAAGVTLGLGLAGALWAASGYVGAFSRAMNRIYEVEEGRPFWRLRPMQLLVTLITVVLCAVSLLILVVSGPVAQSVGRALGAGNDLVRMWDIAKWPVLAVVVMVVVAVLYHATPNVDFGRFRVISAGAFVAILVWLVASIGFAFYVANFSSYNKTYGSVAGVVVALLWLWITNVALLFGAELDAELERGRELQLGIASEEALQLPVRDTRGLEKAVSRRTKDIERMRQFRLAAAGPGDPGDRPFGRR
ncbi:MAG: YihY/virulence factor BrkB family protein [Marmoricola sp.]|nr:YihY/virulence factor BrkB family protein [Marmoricola sp.]